jgi:hypothetical protein
VTGVATLVTAYIYSDATTSTAPLARNANNCGAFPVVNRLPHTIPPVPPSALRPRPLPAFVISLTGSACSLDREGGSLKLQRPSARDIGFSNLSQSASAGHNVKFAHCRDSPYPGNAGEGRQLMWPSRTLRSAMEGAGGKPAYGRAPQGRVLPVELVKHAHVVQVGHAPQNARTVADVLALRGGRGA